MKIIRREAQEATIKPTKADVRKEARKAGKRAEAALNRQFAAHGIRFRVAILADRKEPEELKPYETQRILGILKSFGVRGILSEELRAELGLTKWLFRRRMTELRAQGIVVMTGQRKTARFHLASARKP